MTTVTSEEGREELRAQLAAIVEHSSDAILTKSLDGVITSWNRAAERLYGYTAAEAIGRPVTLIVPSNMPDEIPNIMARLRRGERVEPYETVRRHKDGHAVEVSVAVSPIVAGNGTVTGASSIARDISERKRLERELAASRVAREEAAERLQLAVEVTGSGIYDDAGAGHVYWSPELKDLFGLPRDTPAVDGAATALGFIHPEDREGWLAAMAAARDPNGSGQMASEHRIVRADGSTVWVAQRGRILFTGEGSDRRKTRAIGIVQDITAARLAEEVLRQSQERLRLALSTVRMSVYSQDRDLRYTWIDSPLVPDAAEGRIGKTDADFLAEDEAQELIRLKRQVMSTGKGLRAEVHTTGEGRLRTHDLTIEPLRNAAGAIVGVHGASLDITERKQQEAGRDAFIGILTHDVKNPLTVVQGTAQLLQRRLERSGSVERKQLEDGLGRIFIGAARAVRLLNELLDLARLGAGQALVLERATCDLVAIARTVIDEYQHLAPERELALDAPEPVLTGVWDASRLERVLSNLVNNAIKYSPEGGPVTVSVQRDAAAGLAVLAVQDRGLGIPPEDLPLLFQPYQRGSNIVGRISGAGIGLLSVKYVTEQHGGSVEVESTLGEGSRFVVRLPFSQPGGAEA